MKLTDYINEMGIDRVSKIAGVSRQTVYNWLNLENVPKPETAFLLILESKELLNWEEIYEPYLSTRKTLQK